LTFASAILLSFQIYLGLGVLFALPFLALGVQRLDPAADGAWTFRALVFPGCVALWPVLAVKLLRCRA